MRLLSLLSTCAIQSVWIMHEHVHVHVAPPTTTPTLLCVHQLNGCGLIAMGLRGNHKTETFQIFTRQSSRQGETDDESA